MSLIRKLPIWEELKLPVTYHKRKSTTQKKTYLTQKYIKMNVLLTFEILMYLNIYYFGLYFGMELLFLFLKFFMVDNYTWFLYDLALLLALGAVESFRLYISQVQSFLIKHVLKWNLDFIWKYYLSHISYFLEPVNFF